LDIERIPLGHGGYVEGKSVKSELSKALEFYINFPKDSWLDRWSLFFGWITAYDLVQKGLQARFGKKIERSSKNKS